MQNPAGNSEKQEKGENPDRGAPLVITFPCGDREATGAMAAPHHGLHRRSPRAWPPLEDKKTPPHLLPLLPPFFPSLWNPSRQHEMDAAAEQAHRR